MTKRLPKSSKSVAVLPTDYAPLLAEIKARIRTAQVKAALAANAELVLLYWQMGQRIAEMQAKEGWGAGVIPRLAADLHAEFPEMRGFSERNLKRMIAFYREYRDVFAIGPQASAQLAGGEFVPQPVALCRPGEPSTKSNCAKHHTIGIKNLTGQQFCPSLRQNCPGSTTSCSWRR